MRVITVTTPPTLLRQEPRLTMVPKLPLSTIFERCYMVLFPPNMTNAGIVRTWQWAVSLLRRLILTPVTWVVLFTLPPSLLSIGRTVPYGLY